MESEKKIAVTVGALFLFSTATYFIGSELILDLITAPDYLAQVFTNKSRVIAGILLELICGAAVVGIAVAIFPLLKKYNESMALWYVGFRVSEFTLLAVSAISILSLLTLSEEFAKAGSPDAAHFRTSGVLFIAEYWWGFKLGSIALCFGAFMFYYSLYMSNLVPRFISIWGFAGIALFLTEILLEMFGYGLGMLLFLPGGLNEIFLGIWLIVKGFNPQAISFAQTRQLINS